MTLVTIWKIYGEEGMPQEAIPSVLYLATTTEEEEDFLHKMIAEESCGETRITLEKVLELNTKDEFASLHCAIRFASNDLRKADLEMERKKILEEIEELEEGGRRATTPEGVHQTDRNIIDCYKRISAVNTTISVLEEAV